MDDTNGGDSMARSKRLFFTNVRGMDTVDDVIVAAVFVMAAVENNDLSK